MCLTHFAYAEDIGINLFSHYGYYNQTEGKKCLKICSWRVQCVKVSRLECNVSNIGSWRDAMYQT